MDLNLERRFAAKCERISQGSPTHGLSGSAVPARFRQMLRRPSIRNGMLIIAIELLRKDNQGIGRQPHLTTSTVLIPVGRLWTILRTRGGKMQHGIRRETEGNRTRIIGGSVRVSQDPLCLGVLVDENVIDGSDATGGGSR